MFEFWLVTAILLMIFEVVLGFTIVLFFSSLACFTVAGLMYFNFIALDSITVQFATFFLATTLWALILWKLLKRLVKKTPASDATATSIIGQEATITGSSLHLGKVGTVAWSGTTVKAKLVEDSAHHTLKEGTIVKIVAITDNIFIVREIN